MTYLYDNGNRLIGEHRTGTNPYRNTFSYDPAGNRLVKNLSGSPTTYVYDNANQLQTANAGTGITTYLFDANGNQLIEIAPTGRTTNTWDFENKLILAVSPLLNRVTCVYNPVGTRVRKET